MINNFIVSNMNSIEILDYWTNVSLESIWRENVMQTIQNSCVDIDKLWNNIFVKRIC